MHVYILHTVKTVINTNYFSVNSHPNSYSCLNIGFNFQHINLLFIKSQKILIDIVFSSPLLSYISLTSHHFCRCFFFLSKIKGRLQNHFLFYRYHNKLILVALIKNLFNVFQNFNLQMKIKITQNTLSQRVGVCFHVITTTSTISR